MEVYRICLEQYPRELFASGNRNRWNPRGNFVIYTAGSRALACLENVVHRSGEGLRDVFKIVVIEIPGQVLIESISIDDFACPVEENFKLFTLSTFWGCLV